MLTKGEIKSMIYGYARVSTNHQRITRQITNIKEVEGCIVRGIILYQME